VAEQLVGRAAEQGRSQALLELDPESVAPSVGLLRELLSLKGGLPPDRLARLDDDHPVAAASDQRVDHVGADRRQCSTAGRPRRS